MVSLNDLILDLAPDTYPKYHITPPPLDEEVTALVIYDTNTDSLPELAGNRELSRKDVTLFLRLDAQKGNVEQGRRDLKEVWLSLNSYTHGRLGNYEIQSVEPASTSTLSRDEKGNFRISCNFRLWYRSL